MFGVKTRTQGVIETALQGQAVAADEFVEVPCETMDAYVFENGNPPPDLIKLDVEGAEALVLRGAYRVLAECRPIVLVEVHGAVPAAAVWDVFEPLSYEMSLLQSGTEAPLRSREEWLRIFEASRWSICHIAASPENG